MVLSPVDLAKGYTEDLPQKSGFYAFKLVGDEDDKVVVLHVILLGPGNLGVVKRTDSPHVVSLSNFLLDLKDLERIYNKTPLFKKLEV